MVLDFNVFEGADFISAVILAIRISLSQENGHEGKILNDQPIFLALKKKKKLIQET